MYTGRKKFSIKFELLKEKIHKTKRIRVECCRAPGLIADAGCWAFTGMDHQFHEIENVSSYHESLLSATFQRRNRKSRSIVKWSNGEIVDIAEFSVLIAAILRRAQDGKSRSHRRTSVCCPLTSDFCLPVPSVVAGLPLVPALCVFPLTFT